MKYYLEASCCHEKPAPPRPRLIRHFSPCAAAAIGKSLDSGPVRDGFFRGCADARHHSGRR